MNNSIAYFLRYVGRPSGPLFLLVCLTTRTRMLRYREEHSVSVVLRWCAL